MFFSQLEFVGLNLLEKYVNRVSEFGKVADETSVHVAEAEEGPQFCLDSWWLGVA